VSFSLSATIFFLGIMLKNVFHIVIVFINQNTMADLTAMQDFFLLIGGSALGGLVSAGIVFMLFGKALAVAYS
jgi:hypothetical protein